MKPKKAEGIIREIHQHVERWMAYADRAGVPESTATAIHRAMRRKIVLPA
ncbi:MAG: hypothetical protein NVV74_03595 [Magnetospirillum sp.]|nr:hypothetical protein [Magnetospirillum sp.]